MHNSKDFTTIKYNHSKWITKGQIERKTSVI